MNMRDLQAQYERRAEAAAQPVEIDEEGANRYLFDCFMKAKTVEVNARRREYSAASMLAEVADVPALLDILRDAARGIDVTEQAKDAINEMCGLYVDQSPEEFE